MIAISVDEPFVVEGMTLQLETSIGIAIFPRHGEDAEQLLAQHHHYAFAVALLQVAIALGAVAALTRQRAAFGTHWSPQRRQRSGFESGQMCSITTCVIPCWSHARPQR